MLWIYFDETIVAPVAKDVEGYNWVIFVLMGIGTIMTIMGFLGCCGALQESQCMLATFFALVLVLFAGQVAAMTWINSNTDRFKEVTISSFRYSFQEHYQYNDVKTKAIDIMQQELQCCGAAGSEDWANARFNMKNQDKDIGISGMKSSYEIPASCCDRSLDATACEAVRQVKLVGSLLDNINKEGCAEKVIKLLERQRWMLIIIPLVISLVEILAMIFSMVMCCTARRIDQYKS
ncbi:UNVERIFIED_CONTAM: hypothetical protein GTU68_019968 [Idotea baltica]|nr:hypothetical protein [Idotea baltica]